MNAWGAPLGARTLRRCRLLPQAHQAGDHRGRRRQRRLARRHPPLLPLLRRPRLRLDLRLHRRRGVELSPAGASPAVAGVKAPQFLDRMAVLIRWDVQLGDLRLRNTAPLSAPKLKGGQEAAVYLQAVQVRLPIVVGAAGQRGLIIAARWRRDNLLLRHLGEHLGAAGGAREGGPPRGHDGGDGEVVIQFVRDIRLVHKVPADAE